MTKFIKDFFMKFKIRGWKYKTLIIFLAVLYAGIISISFIKIPYELTSPNKITNVESIISIEGDETNADINTVSVLVTDKPSIMHYLISLMDKNIEKTPYSENTSYYTTSESNERGVWTKKQSIQDAIIWAFDYAAEKGYDVTLTDKYVGVCITGSPSYKLNNGPESLKIGDIVTKIGDTNVTDMNIFRQFVEDVHSTYGTVAAEEIPSIEIIRDEETITLTNCDADILNYLGNVSIYYNQQNSLVSEEYFYDAYTITYAECVPEITINTINSIGPSAGFIHALYVYTQITQSTILNDKYIVGTGTINNEGMVGEIGGLMQKLKTADVYNTQYFFVPKGNIEYIIDGYTDITDVEEQDQMIEDKVNELELEFGLTIIPISNVGDAIMYLEGLGD